MKRNNTLILIVFFGLIGTSLCAQKFDPMRSAKDHIQSRLTMWGVSPNDVDNLKVTDQYQSRHNGLIHIYFQQHYQNIPVYNALLGVHIRPDGRAFDLGHRFIGRLEEKINAVQPGQSPQQAIQSALSFLALDDNQALSLKAEKKNDYLYATAFGDVPVRLGYFPKGSEQLLLSWTVEVDDPRGDNYWILQLDAQTGEVLDKVNQTIHCTFTRTPYARLSLSATDVTCDHTARQHEYKPFLAGDNIGGQAARYRVFPFPVESPAHGQQALVVDPADAEASPFGWHDTNGFPGAEHTTTRGNNANVVWNRSNSTAITNQEPDGGEALIFDFPYEENQEPFSNGLAAATNLFYVNNFIHDLSYHYGFDEDAGNYQYKNYNGQGKEEDPILAVAQYGADIPATPNDNNPGNDYVNNANFTPLPDGNQGLMRMFAWNRSASGAKSLQINTPLTLAGAYEADLAAFGTALSSNPVEGEVVEVDNGGNHEACTVPSNSAELNGKIALIDRGTCDFSKKVYHAQQAGAIAAIICNFEDALIGGMGAGENASEVTIPSIFVKRGDCISIRGFLETEPVQISLLQPEMTGPDSLDGSFDNGIIAHEYTHGISNRLTGGPTTSSCLRDFDVDGDFEPEDGEQMGEGWSDFFALFPTVKPGDNKNTKRGIGTFVYRQDQNGQGVRDYPYSVDMAVNPSTYESIILNRIPYGTGSVWASALWDLYWAFVEEYGWSDDLYYGDKGNNRVMQLVMDAMKLQPCNPTMVEGRDALLMADEVNYNGANKCLIWEVFARRGIGFGADAGNLETRFDNYESFEKLPSCITTVKLSKTVTPLIEAGDEIEVSLVITNHKLTAVTQLNLSDELPEGTSFIPGSSNKPAQSSGGIISFDLDPLASGESDTIRYRLSSSTELNSLTLYYDDMENDGQGWFQVPLEGNKNIWALEELFANSGTKAWAVSNLDESSKQNLQIGEPVVLSGDQPAIRFFHKYDTEPGADGGFVELSVDNGNSWFDARPYLFRNPYRGAIQYTTFAIPNLEAYWGDSEGFIESYIDLSDFKNESVMIQFRFATDDDRGGAGWFVDDVEYLDLFTYNGQTCVSSAEGDQVCAIAPEKGTIVLPGMSTPTRELESYGIELDVFPNPASNLINLRLSGEAEEDIMVQLMGLDGRMVKEKTISGGRLFRTIPLDVRHLPAGFYMVRVSDSRGAITRKVIIE